MTQNAAPGHVNKELRPRYRTLNSLLKRFLIASDNPIYQMTRKAIAILFCDCYYYLNVIKIKAFGFFFRDNNNNILNVTVISHYSLSTDFKISLF